MDPPSKRRRLAPKVPDPPPPPPQPAPTPPYPQEPVAQAPQPFAANGSKRHDFEAFAKHLQDAAMHIYRQAQKSPYYSVSALLLRWEDNPSVGADLGALEKVLREQYGYLTETWNIPTVANPSIKLGKQMASFLEHARTDQLLIIYYAGHGYLGPDKLLYWASNTGEDAAKIKWDGVRCLLEDAQSDILLLLDSCAVNDAPVAGSHGVKQAIAACTPGQSPREPGTRSFTSHLVDSLHKLSRQRFSAQRLCEEIRQSQANESAQPPLTNGAGRIPPTIAKGSSPTLFTLTPGKSQDLRLAALSPPNGGQAHAPVALDGQGTNVVGRGDQRIDPDALADLAFGESRVLVCTTFVGEASPDMAYFNQWINNTPPLASKISVEGIFFGPPTMLMITMPQSVWNVIQHDKVCCYIGHVGSHNLLHLYNRLMSSSSIGAATAKDVEDGRILLEAREAASSGSSKHRLGLSPLSQPRYPGTPSRQPTQPDRAPASLTQRQTPTGEVEDSAEMKEAAEQLKALRHMSNETPAGANQLLARILGATADSKPDDATPSHASGSGPDESQYRADQGTPPSKGRGKKGPQKQTPKQEVRCDLCSHPAFKDPSSLRKHVAAVHTRPFPCAFSFAGCASTFGSKNEWKRHISSQHLCLDYWKCSECHQSSIDPKGNEFNRKDLFTQHLRRMHAPFTVKKHISKADSPQAVEWEAQIKDLQQSCHIVNRKPPQKSACPKPDCQSSFEGPNSWDEWTEHVGRHLEKGEGGQLGVDQLLASWAVDVNVIEIGEDGEYKLYGQSGRGGEKEANHTPSRLSDTAKPAKDATPEGPDPSTITVATAVAASARLQEIYAKMEVEE